MAMSPVTQTALVEVNSASMGVTCAPSRTDTGSISNAAPARITSAKPAAIRRPGGCLLMKFIYLTLLSQNILRNVLRK